MKVFKETISLQAENPFYQNNNDWVNKMVLCL